MILNLFIKCTSNFGSLLRADAKRRTCVLGERQLVHDRQRAARDGEGVGLIHAAVAAERSARGGTEPRPALECVAAFGALLRDRGAAQRSQGARQKTAYGSKCPPNTQYSRPRIVSPGLEPPARMPTLPRKRLATSAPKGICPVPPGTHRPVNRCLQCAFTRTRGKTILRAARGLKR